MLVWPRKYAHSSYNSSVHSLLPKDNLLRTYFININEKLDLMCYEMDHFGKNAVSKH